MCGGAAQALSPHHDNADPVLLAGYELGGDAKALHQVGVLEARQERRLSKGKERKKGKGNAQCQVGVLEARQERRL